jgi:hypothetical protein
MLHWRLNTGFAKTSPESGAGILLPLPSGEGWGEGKLALKGITPNTQTQPRAEKDFNP